jgi:hypothetical protein
MRIRDLRVLFFGQAALTAGFLAAGWWIANMDFPQTETRAVLVWRPNQHPSISNNSDTRSVAALGQALSRPLFRVSRKPFDPSQVQQQIAITQPPQPIVQAEILPQPPTLVPDSAVVTAQPVPVPQFVLKGISIESHKKRALVASAEKPDGDWLAIGGNISGWKLIGLDSNTAQLSHDDQQVTLSLYVDNAAKSVGNP